MKKMYLISLLAIASLTFSSSYAQGRQGAAQRTGNCNFSKQGMECQISGLSTQQQEQLAAERVKFLKDTQAERNQLNEWRARKQTLLTTDPVDQKELDNILESMNRVSTTIHKKKVRHHQAIKAFLTEEQVLQFDNRRFSQNRKGKNARGMQGQGYGHGSANKGRGQGAGYGQGRGQNSYNKQRRRAQCYQLSDEQNQVLKTARVEMMSKQQAHKNRLNELRAQLKTVCTCKNIDLKKADQIIDEQAQTRLEMAKVRTAFRVEMRSQLTDEQAILWNNRPRNGRKGCRQMR